MSLPARMERLFANRFVNRIAHKAAFALAMLMCIAWSLAQARHAPPAGASSAAPFQEWPAEWDGARLRPQALGPVEQRFAERFPGTIARLTDGHQTLVLRSVQAPTRMLHPAADCYRALGYRVEQPRLVRDAKERRWRCFAAKRSGGQPLEVCERIVGADGVAFTDSSAWYWAAVSGRSAGPWQALTLATPVN